MYLLSIKIVMPFAIFSWKTICELILLATCKQNRQLILKSNPLILLITHLCSVLSVSTTDMMTFTFFLPVSTYLCASTMSSIGKVLSTTAIIFPASISSLRKMRFSTLSLVDILLEWNEPPSFSKSFTLEEEIFLTASKIISYVSPILVKYSLCCFSFHVILS